MSELVNARRLEDYQGLVVRVPCRWCNGNLGSLEHYDHDGGWPVVGYSTPQWLFATCVECKYQWALWKLLQYSKRSFGRYVARRTFGTKPPQPRVGAGFCTPGYETACQRAKNSTCVCACEGKNHRKFSKVKVAFAKNLGVDLYRQAQEEESQDGSILDGVDNRDYEVP